MTNKQSWVIWERSHVKCVNIAGVGTRRRAVSLQTYVLFVLRCRALAATDRLLRTADLTKPSKPVTSCLPICPIAAWFPFRRSFINFHQLWLTIRIHRINLLVTDWPNIVLSWFRFYPRQLPSPLNTALITAMDCPGEMLIYAVG